MRPAWRPVAVRAGAKDAPLWSSRWRSGVTDSSLPCASGSERVHQLAVPLHVRVALSREPKPVTRIGHRITTELVAKRRVRQQLDHGAPHALGIARPNQNAGCRIAPVTGHALAAR